MIDTRKTRLDKQAQRIRALLLITETQDKRIEALEQRVQVLENQTSCWDRIG